MDSGISEQAREQAGRELQAAAAAEQSDMESAGASPAERITALSARASVCTACALHLTRTKVVFGEGNPEAPLMLIGEGPGQNEDATGRPFVGRSGSLLDECLRENGILRKHVYICNVIRCRACALEAGRLKNRPPTPDEARACSPWLDQTIAIVQPLVILCLGAPAASAIIHRGFKMMQERGQWFETRYVRHAMATLHPAYVLRQEGESYEASRRNLVADIASARQRVIEAKRETPRTLF
jgi:uracil-DNA glycosylase family protein